ncbi:MAG: nuclear transport factor 2 family protein [Acidobacteria bacterium]|nr:MAG: nuclear transport factor 2 family protein [Acidobacteriota bacterium]
MSQDNLDVIRQGYDAFGRGDITTLLGLFDEQIEWVSSGPPELITSGRRTGRQAVAEFFTAVNEVFDIQRFDPQEFIAQGDRVVVLGHESARVRATGKVIDSDWAHVFTMKNGKVVAFQEYVDTALVVAELRAAHASA